LRRRSNELIKRLTWLQRDKACHLKKSIWEPL
jgi:hypothetical protein